MVRVISGFLSRLSVTWKILLLFGVLACAIGIFLIGLSFILFAKYQDMVVADQAHHTSDSIVYVLETMERRSQLEKYVAIVAAEPVVDLILVLDAETGFVLLSNKGDMQGRSLLSIEDDGLRGELSLLVSGDAPLSDVRREGDRVSLAVPARAMVLVPGEAVGAFVFIRLKTKYITAQSSAMAQRLFVGLGVGLMFAVLIASRFLYALVILPLSRLGDIAQSHAVDAASMAPFTARSDEFGELARSILFAFTEARQTAEKFVEQTRHDSLTGLANRVMFHDQLQSRLENAEGSGRGVGLMVLDLDHFKEVNDMFGQHVGDQLLVQVADVLRENTGRADLVIRVGGDEFAVIFDDVVSVERLLDQADEILVALRGLGKTSWIDGHQVHTDASIGVTIYPQDGREPDVLLRNADLALHQAKTAGGGNAQLYRHELHLRAIERTAIERDLCVGISDNQFILHYQPKIDLATGDISGVEALIRWQHPERGLVWPDVFIPIAEKSGIICDLTDWVLSEACQQIRTWMDKGVGPVRIAVNVSALDLRRPDFTDRVAATLISAGVSPKFLEIEVTESTMMHDVDQVIGTLRRLRAFGVSLSIDDFGTGYSSLAYLQRFPVQRLKIDRSFVIDMSADTNSQAIPRLIIDLARNLGVSVLAEGVETQEQRDILALMGCHEAQGYLFGAPVLAETLENLLRQKIRFPSRPTDEKRGPATNVISVA